MNSPTDADTATRWGSDIVEEELRGVRFRLYAQRPKRVTEILPLARRWGTRAHVIQGDQQLSFDQLLSAVDRKAELLLSEGISATDRVLMLGWNSPEWIVNFWACERLGAAPALANAWWSAAEVTDAVDLLQPAMVLADDAHGPDKMPVSVRRGPWAVDLAAATSSPVNLDDPRTEPADENDPAVIIFTSGSGGRPKAVELSNRSLVANLQMLLHMTHRLPDEVAEESGEVVLHTGPLFHVGGPQMLLRSIAVGNTIVMPSGRFDPGEALELIERHQATRWAAVPTMVSRLLDHPDVRTRNLHSLRAVTIGGAPVHAELLERLGSTLPSVTAGAPTGYGLTENCGQATAASGRDTLKNPGTAGRPLPCVELKFAPVDGMPDAEVLVRSPTQMTRYIGTDESPIDSEGWLHTGDLGRLDEGGRLWITGRSKDLIIRGGENIAPAAVERVLAGLPGVAEVAVVGVPHPDLGEQVCAFVVTNDSTPPTPETLREGMRGQVASFSIPSIWHIQRDPLPTNHTGKVDKIALARFAAGQQ